MLPDRWLNDTQLNTVPIHSEANPSDLVRVGLQEQCVLEYAEEQQTEKKAFYQQNNLLLGGC